MRQRAAEGARRRFLMLGIAWRWQVEVLGGARRGLQRRLAALEATCASGQSIEPDRRGARPLLPGTRLVCAIGVVNGMRFMS